MTRQDEEDRAEQWREDQRQQEAARRERLALLAGDAAEYRAFLERWEPVILAQQERER